LAELRDFVDGLRKAYQKAGDFISDLSILAEKGGRFTRQVTEFLKKIFADGEERIERRIDFRKQLDYQGDPLRSGVRTDKALVLGGRNGTVMLLDVASSRAIDTFQLVEADILSMAVLDGGRVALGTHEGLSVVTALGRGTVEEAAYSERVTAIAVAPWGNVPHIVTGSKEGMLRDWVYGSTIYRDQEQKVGRSIQKMLVRGDDLVVASDENVVFISRALKIKHTVPVQFRVQDMAFLNNDTVVACGMNQLAHVNLSKGTYTRILSAVPTANYLAVAKLTEEVFCAGSDDGFVRAVDFYSNEEVGRLDVGFPVHGLIAENQRLLAFGGAWNSRGRTAAMITWTEARQ
jgi:hypothetical protein